MLVGTGGIFVFEKIVRKALAKAGLKLPSSLVSMVAAFVLLKVSVSLVTSSQICVYILLPFTQNWVSKLAARPALAEADRSPPPRRHT